MVADVPQAPVVVVAVVRRCERTYTVDMATRAIHAAYRAMRDVTDSDRANLRRYVRCQRNVGARPYVRGVWRRSRAAWSQRRLERPQGYAVASYFDDSPGTACGFRARFGVAHLSLPCGTRVRFWLDGRSAVGVVEDRGPAAWTGHTWDFNVALADYFGLTDGRGVATVGYRVGG